MKVCWYLAFMLFSFPSVYCICHVSCYTEWHCQVLIFRGLRHPHAALLPDASKHGPRVSWPSVLVLQLRRSPSQIFCKFVCSLQMLHQHQKKQNKVMYSLTCRLYITSFFCSFFQKHMKMFLNICFCWFRCEFWKKNLQPLLAVTLTPTRRSWKWPWNSAFSVYMPTPVRRARPATLKIIHLHRL